MQAPISFCDLYDMVVIMSSFHNSLVTACVHISQHHFMLQVWLPLFFSLPTVIKIYLFSHSSPTSLMNFIVGWEHGFTLQQLYITLLQPQLSKLSLSFLKICERQRSYNVWNIVCVEHCAFNYDKCSNWWEKLKSRSQKKLNISHIIQNCSCRGSRWCNPELVL